MRAVVHGHLALGAVERRGDPLGSQVAAALLRTGGEEVQHRGPDQPLGVRLAHDEGTDPVGGDVIRADAGNRGGLEARDVESSDEVGHADHSRNGY